MTLKKVLLTFITIIVALSIILVAWQILKLSFYIKRTVYNEPYQHINPSASLKILFLGDSTAVGTGADTNRHSVAGWFSRDFPDAQIINFSHNGWTIKELLDAWHPKALEHYNLAVIQIGGNDVLRFSKFKDIAQELPQLLKEVSAVADHIVILHSGNIGIAPVFIWPFDWIMTQRTIKLRAMYMDQAPKFGTLYIDLFHERKDDPLNENIPLYYSPDHLHPSGDGYRKWYEFIRQALTRAGVNL